ALAALVAGTGSTLPSAYAGGTIKADEDKWISVGMGIRTSFSAVEGASPAGHYSNEFNIDNARIYINGKIHKYIGFEFNTDCFQCSFKDASGVTGPGGTRGSNSSIGLLDAIGKFEFNEMFNLWVGRMLLPSERGELNGPFYHATYDGFRTPFFPSDQSGNFNAGSGLYGRDNAATFWGKFHPFGTHLLYAVAVSQGLRTGAAGINGGNSLMYTGRLQWNLLNDEKNPGYYTAGTYYGTAGDILAIAGSVQHQKDGAGTGVAGGTNSDFTGLSVDVLFEKVLPNNMGVFTFNGEFKRFFANYGAPTATGSVGAGCFCIFNGHSWTVYALYLIPQEIGIGRFQPYIRYTSIDPRYGDNRNEWEPGINYVISGHNARVSAFYRYGDIGSGPGGGNYLSVAPNAAGLHGSQKVDSFHVALQLQY
ncbi:MAG: hypothetical protein HP497_02130, partial [Nitrospira sp.]|nr:hypothetical protein [Nitrospira sp.]